MPPGVEQGEAIYVGPRPGTQASRIADQALADIDAAANDNATRPRFAVTIGQAVIIDDGDKGLEHWEDAGDPWDVLVVGGKPMPGVWEIESCERRHKLDRKKSPKKDGANVTDLGSQPAKITCRGQLYSKPDALRQPNEPNHWRMLQKRLEEINPRAHGKLRAPLTIYHPAIAITGINTVYLECVRAPRIRDGVLEISLEFVEYTAPKVTKAAKAPTPPVDLVSEQFAANMRATPAQQLYGFGISAAEGTDPANQKNRGKADYGRRNFDGLSEQEKRSLVARPSNSQVQPGEFSLGTTYRGGF